MNRLKRWWRFNLVGALGMVLQLSALMQFNRRASGHYLIASAAAIELTLLHNFIWHVHYTWRDRRGQSTLPAQLTRFHLTNGLVSIFGNLAVVRTLVGEARWSVLVANCFAILCCSLINFYLGDRWIFGDRVLATLVF